MKKIIMIVLLLSLVACALPTPTPTQMAYRTPTVSEYSSRTQATPEYIYVANGVSKIIDGDVVCYISVGNGISCLVHK
jgi:hypothetical protein